MIGHSFPTLEELPYIQTMHNKPFNTPGTPVPTLALAVTALIATVAALGQAPATGAQASAGQPAAPAPKAAAGAPAGPAAAQAAPGEQPQEPPTEAERLIDLAIKQVAGLKSVAADMLQSVEMLKQKFDVKGKYLKAPSSRIYLKLTISGLPDASGTMLQVCDGVTLWDYQQVLEQQLYRKMTVQPVLERLNAPEIDAKTREQIMTQMGFAGPEALLLGLRKTIKFDQKESGEIEGKPAWVLRGTWRSRNGLIGPDQRQLPLTGPLPPYVPSTVTLYLGQKDGWPYKIVMVGKVPSILQDTRRIGPDGRPIGSRSSIEKVEPSRIEMVYSNVQLNPEIRVEEFAFQAPPNAQVEDTTDTIIKGLEQAIQIQAMQKRSEAARQEGPVLDQSIEIPARPPTVPTPK
jgi:outer membrane lipoprotein-sorting protein